jgi:hypothetical protein
MNIRCAIGLHKWVGCRCTECRLVRDREHDWSEDCQKCSRCDGTRTKPHEWQTTAVDWRCISCATRDVNAQDKLGWTPLHEAAWMGRNNLITTLIGAGADVNAKSNDCMTPLHAAAAGGRASATRLLAANGAATTAKSQGGLTPLALARRKLAERTEEFDREQAYWDTLRRAAAGGPDSSAFLEAMANLNNREHAKRTEQLKKLHDAVVNLGEVIEYLTGCSG